MTIGLKTVTADFGRRCPEHPDIVADANIGERMRVMATKAEERKALIEIEKIVLGLGVGSYVATAFEGCWEIAKSNIENDFACSMRQRVEYEQEQVKEAKETLKYRDAELADKEKEIRDLRKTVETLTANRDDLLERLKKTEETGMQIIEERSALQAKCSEQVDEILHLKAKLYDLITGKEG